MGNSSGYAEDLNVSPLAFTLNSPESTLQLLVTLKRDGASSETTSGVLRPSDVTRKAAYRSTDKSVATVSDTGVVIPRADGLTEILVSFGSFQRKVQVTVSGLVRPEPISFANEVVPILAKAGCSSGGCHGKAEGQNGFRLSIFGSDPQFDFDAISKNARGRRLQSAAPARSLLLRKATADLPHGGGHRLDPTGHRYQRLLRWIAEGAEWHDDMASEIVTITVEPTDVVLDLGHSQQLQVMATDRSGRRRDVTFEAEYQSNAEVVAGVGSDGLVAVHDPPGAAAILVRYAGHVAVCRVTHPQSRVSFTRPSENNFIDTLAWDRLEELGISPSVGCDDATFMRRAYLDVIGTLPTAEEAIDFLADKSLDKRPALVDRLLTRPEYAAYWTMVWSDLLGADKESLTPQGAVALSRWLREQFRDNRPYDEWATDIVVARGYPTRIGPAGFYSVHKTPERMGKAFSQIFLGVRIECAECHHHPFERWSQQDYFALSGMFSGVTAPKAVGGGTKIVGSAPKPLKHPRTGELVVPAPLGADLYQSEGAEDPRVALAAWLTKTDNPFFARAMVNRMWAHYMGRGLVEPVDDLRATNPATNERLLDALADYLVKSDYDIHALTKVILVSQVYQRDTTRNDSNQIDEQNYSAASWKRLPAEVLLDAICAATGVPEEFNGWPKGYRAIEVWDNRMPSYFFKAFGRPQRVSVCACERGTEPSVSQALHLMNAPETYMKLRHRDGAAAAMAASELSSTEIVRQIYLRTLSRYPSEAETSFLEQAFVDVERREAVEDVFWALMNTKEFLFNH
jgi:hypothetical protein